MEVQRKAYLASLVPVIVNTVLNEHQLVADIVAFVAKGDFPRSRLGEKQRGKILASWVTRKMRTVAQFGIRDPDGADSSITAVPEDRVAGGASSLHHSNTNASSDTHGPPQRLSTASDADPSRYSVSGPMDPNAPQYESSIVESPPPPPVPDKMPYDAESTPTGGGKGEYFPQPGRYDQQGAGVLPSQDYFGQDPPLHDPEQTPQPRGQQSFDKYGNSAQMGYGGGQGRGLDSRQEQRAQPTYVAYHPSRSREGSQDPGMRAVGGGGGDGGGGASGGGGGLRITNAADDDEEDWPQEALMHMRRG